jgi:hypothetical protein
MEVLQQTLNKVMALPTSMLERLISKKLRAQGVKFPKTLPTKLAEHILSGAPEPFRYAGRTQPEDISLSFDEADNREIARAVDRFLEDELPAFIPVMAERVSMKILKDLKRGWIEEGRLQQVDLSRFRGRMEETWGKPLGQLRMLLTIAREWCGETHGEANDSETHGKSRLKKLTHTSHIRQWSRGER